MDLDVEEHLKLCARQSDERIDLGRLCLMMMYGDHEGVSIDRHINHLQKNASDVRARHKKLIENGADDDAGTQLAALKYVLHEVNGYDLDGTHQEILENADLIRVIDRAKGCQAALCVLYMDAARKNGWQLEGINFPGRYLCRLQKGGERILFDPANGCSVLQAHDLRLIVKEALGEDAELSNDYLNAADIKKTVIHLHNNIKLRRIEMGDYKDALKIVNHMRLLVPDEYRLLLDAGVLYARTNQTKKAVEALNVYIEKAPNYYDREEATLLLGELHIEDDRDL